MDKDFMLSTIFVVGNCVLLLAILFFVSSNWQKTQDTNQIAIDLNQIKFDLNQAKIFQNDLAEYVNLNSQAIQFLSKCKTLQDYNENVILDCLKE